jgi:hypothetical protein
LAVAEHKSVDDGRVTVEVLGVDVIKQAELLAGTA